MTDEQLTWYAGACDTGDELKVAERLRKEGLTVVCPSHRALSRPGKKRKPVETTQLVAAYPGYVFLNRGSVVDLERVCFRTKGFHYILSFSQRYSQCSDSDLQRAMEYVKFLEERGVFCSSTPDRLARKMLEGCTVKVFGGPFGGRTGIVETVKGTMATLIGYDFPKRTRMQTDRLIVEQIA